MSLSTVDDATNDDPPVERQPMLPRNQLRPLTSSSAGLTDHLQIRCATGKPLMRRPPVKRLFVTNVAPNTSAADMLKFLSNLEIPQIAVLRLRTQSEHCASFFIAVPMEHYGNLAKPTNWITGLRIKEYFG